MKFFIRFFITLVVVYFITAQLIIKCHRDIYKGDIGGIYQISTTWDAPIPNDMVVIPATKLISRGHYNYEDSLGNVGRSKVISVSSFLMDRTLVTNFMYKLFIAKRLEQIEAENEEPKEEEKESTIVEKGEETEEGGEKSKRKKYTKEYILSLKPDKDVWSRDFAHHMQGTRGKLYFEHAAFGAYPVVGVTWEAAKEFCIWRTEFFNEYRKRQGLEPAPSFRLPTSLEFEAAAKGGIPNAKYPWGSNPRDAHGRVMANYKSLPADYIEKGGSECYTTPVKYFNTNGYGLYDMNGNVFQWCEDAKYPAEITDTWDLNSVYINDDEPLKKVMGGSFNSILRPCGYYEYRHEDRGYADVGFRCVMDYYESNIK